MKRFLVYINNINRERHPKIRMLLFFILPVVGVVGQYNLSTTTLATYSKKNQKPRMFMEGRERDSQEPVEKAVADSLFALTNSHIKKGDFSKALNTVTQGLAIYRAIDAHKAVGHCYSKIASIYYYQAKYTKALRYFEKSIELYRTIDFKRGMASSANNKGAIYYYLGQYPKALAYYKQAVKLDEGLGAEAQAAATIQNIGGIYLEMNDYTKAMYHFQKAKRNYERVPDKKKVSQVLNAIGEIYVKQEKYTKALMHFKEALQLARAVNDPQRILESIYKLGELYGAENKYKKSLGYYNKCLQLATGIENELYRSLSLTAIGSIYYKLGKNEIAVQNCNKGLEIAKVIQTILEQKEACTCLYKAYKSLNKKGMALAYFEQMVHLKDRIKVKQTSEDLLHMQFEHQMLKDSILHLEKKRKLQFKHGQELAKKEKQRNILIISGCFVLVVAGGLWNRLKYTKKSRARLQLEKDRSEHLLLNILPEEIAEELKEKGYVDAQDVETASILFTDFKSFTETAATLSPQELVAEINSCFKAFDGIMETYGIEKIKTIGDAYMAAGGLPQPDTKAVKNIILAALDMQTFILQRKKTNNLGNKPAFDMRVGIHVGPIVAGIVGVKKFQYDIWGDTVNTASRMESNGAVGKVNISEDTYMLIKEEKEFAFEYRGKVNAKGKGELGMYFVSRS